MLKFQSSVSRTAIHCRPRSHR